MTEPGEKTGLGNIEQTPSSENQMADKHAEFAVEVTDEMRERMCAAAEACNIILHELCANPAEMYATLSALLEAHALAHGIKGVRTIKGDFTKEH